MFKRKFVWFLILALALALVVSACQQAQPAADDAADTVEEIADDAADTAEETAADAEEAVDEAAEDVEDAAEETAADAEEAVEDAVDEAEEAVADAEEAVDEAAEDVEDAAEETAADAEEAVEDAVDEAEEAVEGAEEAVDEAAEEVADDADEAVDEAVDEAEDAVADAEEAVDEAAEEVADDAEEAVDEAVDEAEDAVADAEEAAEEAVEEAEDAVADAEEAVDEAMDESSDEAMSDEEATEEGDESTEEMADTSEDGEEMADTSEDGEEMADESMDGDEMTMMGTSVMLAPDEPVRLGYAGALSGEGVSAFGVDIRRGMELALEDRPTVTVDGVEFTVELDPQDSQCSPEGGQAVANRFVSDESIVGVVGPMCSSACEAAMPIFDEAGFTTISASCTAVSLTAGDSPSFNRSVASDGFQGVVAAEFIYNDLGVTRIVMIDDGSAYGEGLADIVEGRFVELGGEVLDRDAIAVGDTDFRALLSNFESLDPELIYFAGFNAEAARLLEQVEDVGLEDRIFMGADGIYGTELIELAGDLAEGVYASTAFPRTSEDLDAFIARYEETYGEGPASSFNTNAYDATNLLLNAIESVGYIDDNGDLVVERDALAEYVRSAELDGLSGPLACVGTGDCATAEIGFFQIVDGVYERVGTVTDEAATDEEMSDDAATEEGAAEATDESGDEEMAEDESSEEAMDETSDEEMSDDASTEEGDEEASDESTDEEMADDETSEDATDESSDEEMSDEAATEEGDEEATDESTDEAMDESTDEEMTDEAADESSDEAAADDETSEEAMDESSDEETGDEAAADESGDEEAADAETSEETDEAAEETSEEGEAEEEAVAEAEEAVEEAPVGTILDFAATAAEADEPEFTLFTQALAAAGLDTQLGEEGDYTVFAPTDAAFESALENLGVTFDELLEDGDLLTAILQYHIASGALSSADIEHLKGHAIGTLFSASEPSRGRGNVLTVDETDEGLTIGGILIIQTDIETSNGTLHIINGVLVPTIE